MAELSLRRDSSSRSRFDATRKPVGGVANTRLTHYCNPWLTGIGPMAQHTDEKFPFEDCKVGTMKTQNRVGFTRNELLVVVVVVVILALVLYPIIRTAREQAVSASMKSRTRGIWCAVISVNAERQPLGLPSVWPKDLGFDSSHTSTEYFRMLMSDDQTGTTNEPSGPICADLKPSIFGGGGVPVADSVSSFSSANNAWNVICVSTQTPNNELNGPGVPFLITRNVTMGHRVNGLSPLVLSEKSRLWIHRCVYLTVGGGCFDRRKEYLSLPSGRSAVLEDMGTNTVYDVMFP